MQYVEHSPIEKSWFWKNEKGMEEEEKRNRTYTYLARQPIPLRQLLFPRQFLPGRRVKS
jgi:hypothetical protein